MIKPNGQYYLAKGTMRHCDVFPTFVVLTLSPFPLRERRTKER
jgi:hypothetical protein